MQRPPLDNAAEPALLTPDLLESLIAHPASEGAPIADALRPGLTDDEMDELTAPLGLRLPEEMRVLWRWHNGVRAEANSRAVRLGGFEVLSLQEAIDLCEREQATAGEVEDDPSQWFPMHFLPFARDGPDPTCGDCSDPGAHRVSVYWLPSHDTREEAIAVPEVESLGEWAKWQHKALDNGLYRFDPKLGRWAFEESSPANPRGEYPRFLP